MSDTVAATIDARQEQIATDQATQAAYHAKLEEVPIAEYRELREKGPRAVAAEPVAPVEPADAPAAVAKPARADQPVDATSAVERDDAGRFKSAKPRDDPKARSESIQAEINRRTWEKHEAERQLEDVRAETARLKADADAANAAKPAVTSSGAFPAFDQWLATNSDKTYEDYIDARADAKIDARLKAVDAQRSAAEASKAARARIDAHLAKVEQAKSRYADWDDVAKQVAHIPIPPTLHDAVLSSDRSEDIVYWLGTHPDQYLQLARDASGLAVTAAPLMRRVLESYLPSDAAPVTGPASSAQHSRAKTPPKPVGGSPQLSADIDPEDETPEQYRARRMAERKARSPR